MKKSFLIILATLSLSIFNACEKNELQLDESVIKNPLIENGNYMVISSSDWDALVSDYSSEDYSSLKSASTFESMWDVLMKLDGLAGDSTKVDEYKELAAKHSKILKGNFAVGYDLITSSAFIAKSFSSDGLLRIDDKVYEIQPGKFIEYSEISKGEYQVVELERKIEIFAINTDASLKSVFWQSPTVQHDFSSSRRVRAYLFKETIPNSTLQVFGAYSKYYKKSWGSWREHQSRNGIELYFSLHGVPKVAGSFLYYPGIAPPDRATMIAEAIDNFGLYPITNVMVHYYRHPASDGSTPPSVTWYGSDFDL